MANELIINGVVLSSSGLIVNGFGDVEYIINGEQSSFDDYSFFVEFLTGQTPTDKVSSTSMQTTGLAAGRVSYHGGSYGINEPAVDVDGLFGCGVIENLIDDPEDTSQWSGSGPWTNIVTVGVGTHVLSTDVDVATVSISAGTATIGGTATATFGNPDTFDVTGAGTVIIQTDTEDPKAQITATACKLPYVNGLSPENYSDADQGYKFPIDEMSKLRDALDGVADGTILISEPEFTTYATTTAGSVIDDNTFASTGIGGVYKQIIESNTRYEVFIDLETTSSDVALHNALSSTAFIGRNGTHRFTGGDTVFYLRNYSAGTTTVSALTLREVSPAKGKITVKWRPMFNSGDLTGTINILTANDEAGSFLFFDATNNLLKVTDGTNTSQVACSPVADTEYTIDLAYDGDLNKLVISLDTIEGITTAFVGRFPVADDLSFFWDAQAPQYVSIVEIAKDSGLEAGL